MLEGITDATAMKLMRVSSKLGFFCFRETNFVEGEGTIGEWTQREGGGRSRRRVKDFSIWEFFNY